MSMSLRAIKISSILHKGNILRSAYKKGYSSSIRFLSLQKQFEEAKSESQQLNVDVGNETKLKLYGLFKQATEGPPSESKQLVSTDFVGQAKLDAWKQNENLSKEDAQRKYIELGNQVSIKDYECLLIEQIGNLRKITFNRPKRFNAFNFQLFDELVDAFKEAESDSKTAIAALTGAGTYFTSGNDLGNFAGFSQETAPKIIKELKYRVLRIVDSLIDFPKPLVAVVNGPAIGIGVTLLPHCDLVYCSDRATFNTPFSSLGQTPEGGSTKLFPLVMGPSKANEILMFNKKITAEEAREAGLVSEVFAHDTLESEAWKRIEEYSKLPAKSLFYSKELLRSRDRDLLHKVNASECERLAERMASQDCFNAIESFQNRKKK